MAKKGAYQRHTEQLQQREKQLRDDIEVQSSALEKKVKTGLVIGLIVLVVSSVLYFVFRNPGKPKRKKEKSGFPSQLIRWVIEYVSMELIKQFWKSRKAKLKGS